MKQREPIEILNYLAKISVCEQNADGRINSLIDEDLLIDALIDISKNHKGFKVEKAPIRHWYDVKINDKPVQIKSSTGGTDNWSSKKSIAYALTDLEESEIDILGNRHKTIQRVLANNVSKHQKPRDMDIFCIDKNTGKVYHTTLCTLSKLTSNGNNLPFQINWKYNWKRPSQSRTYTQARKFVLGAYIESIEKKQAQDDLKILKESFINC
jgi:hypothetical protein